MSLFDIASQYTHLLEQVFEEENINETALVQLNEIKESVEQKSIAVASYIKNIDAERKAIEEAKAEMDRREKSLQKRVDYLTNYLKDNMERCAITEIKCPYFQIKLKKCPVSVDVYDEDVLTEDYKKTKIVVNVDKAKLREEMMAGVVVEGARLKQNTRIEIR